MVHIYIYLFVSLDFITIFSLFVPMLFQFISYFANVHEIPNNPKIYLLPNELCVIMKQYIPETLLPSLLLVASACSRLHIYMHPFSTFSNNFEMPQAFCGTKVHRTSRCSSAESKISGMHHHGFRASTDASPFIYMAYILCNTSYASYASFASFASYIHIYTYCRQSECTTYVWYIYIKNYKQTN